MTTLCTIQVSQELKFPPESELFAVLEKLLPIKFIVGEQNGTAVQAAIFEDSEGSKIVTAVPSLSLPLPGDSGDLSVPIETEVKFSDDPDVPFPFRGRKVNTKLVKVARVLSMYGNERALATNEQGVIWSVSEIDGVKRFRSALPLPHISAEQNFNDVFNGECFLQMLVSLQFIRQISVHTNYQNAPLRASFIIDDPNLHWPSYGFIDYREIAALAQNKNFHLSFATIPLDAWFVHKATADLFGANPKRLSLLVHGNNHAKEELALNYSDDSRKALLVQAIRRIEQLEKKSNLHVSRVMVPPHGACSNKMLSDLPNCGFESACISTGSLRFHNPTEPWAKTLGFFPSELIEGCPVLPRWGLTGNVENTLLVAAFLGQPLILRGHHQDLKGGGGKFIDFAKFINGLGDVTWCNMTDLSRLNYQWRAEGTTAWIKPLGRDTVFKIPEGVTEIIIESPSEVDACAWHVVLADGSRHDIVPGKGLPVAEGQEGEILIHRHTTMQHPYASEKSMPTPPKLILRRLLTEARDRLLLSD